jgi:hypothetical protein
MFQKKQWEISFIAFKTSKGDVFKITRRIPHLFVAATKLFASKELAKKQLNEWLA